MAMRGLVPGRVIRGWFGSRSSFRVFSFPGANAVAVRACRAADSSPWWMSWHALLAWWSGCGSWGGFAGEAAVARARWSKANHWPDWNAWIRAYHSGLGSVLAPGCLCKSILGSKSQSFHARTVCCSVSAALMASSAVASACRIRPLKKGGGDWKPKNFCFSTVSRSTWSRLSKACLNCCGCWWGAGGAGGVAGWGGLLLGLCGRVWHGWLWARRDGQRCDVGRLPVSLLWWSVAGLAWHWGWHWLPPSVCQDGCLCRQAVSQEGVE